MKCRSVILLFSLFFLISCTVTDSDNSDIRIVGQWELIRSYGGIGGVTLTPDSENFTASQITFYSNNRFSYLRADTVFSTGRYSLNSTNGDVTIQYKSEGPAELFNQRVEFSGVDTLILQDECFDCYTNTFIRLP